MEWPWSIDPRRRVADEVKRGRYPDEEAVLVAALDALDGLGEGHSLEALVDLRFEAQCAREGDASIKIEEVLATT